MSMDPSKNLEKQLFSSINDLIEALATPAFYFEMLMIGCSVALAILVATLINQRIRLYVHNKPPKFIATDLLLRSLSLVTPILEILYFTIVKPFAERYGDGGFWINAAVQLTVSYVVARIILLVVKSKPIAYLLAAIVMLQAALRVSGFLKVTVSYLDSMSFEIGSINLSLLKIINGLIILVVVMWAAGSLSRTLESYLRRSSSLSFNARELMVKFLKIFIYFIAFMITLSSIGVDLTAFAVFGGALGVGIGLGLQKLTANFISGISLLLEKSIQIGDLIQIGSAADNMTGWVRQLNIRYTLVESPDGREILIPNEELMSTRVINWTHSNNRGRVEILVNLSYDIDPNLAMKLMLEAANEHPMCIRDPKASCFLREFGENTLKYSLVFWVADVRDGRLGPQSDVMLSILDKFKAAGMRIPLPERDFRIIQSPV